MSAMPLPSTLSSALSFAFGAGLVQAVLALVFWLGRGLRPSWGLRWLALSFACAAVVNLGSTAAAAGLPGPVGLLYVLNLVCGLGALGALVVGVHQFTGIRSWHPGLVFVATTAGFVALVAALRALGVVALGGHLATAVIFLYLATLSAGALYRLAGAGHGVVLASLLLYPALVLAALVAGVDKVLLSLWAAVPYTLMGVGLLVAGIGRYHLELGAELARRERAEADLRALNASLEQRIAERTAELQTLVGELRSFNRMVSHDLRGPLGGLVGLAALAGQTLDSGDAARVKHMLAVMGKEMQRLLGLVGELLALARASHGEIERAPVSLEGVFDEAQAALALSLGARAAQRVVREPLPACSADAALLRQVFINLISNALKFSSSRPDTEVRVRARRAAGEIVVEVRDEGVGFDAARAAELFRPFGRLHGADFAGTGIGLSIVRRIVERHGGRVWAEGRPGAGASFFFALPDATPEMAPESLPEVVPKLVPDLPPDASTRA